MITPSKEGISKDGSQYYGSAEYYSEKNDLGEVENKHAPMEWVGRGAELLGLPSEIKTEHDLKVFDDLIKGKLPDGREMPQIAPNGKERRTGEDIVVSAPKSVSIMATYGRDERILEAHRKAVLATVAKIQERRMAVRGMVDGQQERVDGEFVIALAQHLDSRPVDGFVGADLHTHVLVMNVAIRTSDDELRAVDWLKEEGWQKEDNATYLSELAHNIREIGYDTYETKDAFEIAGITREMIEDYSPRLKAIERELEKMGLTRATATAEQKQAAAFKTREGKGTVTHDQMIAQGDKLAAEKGYDFQSIREAALLNERHETHEQRMDMAAEALKSAARHFSERQSVFEAKEVIKYALKSGLPNGVTERELRQAWIERKDKHGLLTAKSPIDPKTGEVSKERFMTTRLALARDEKMINNLRAGKGAIAENERWTPQEVQREIADFEAKKGFKLSPDQVAAVHLTLGTADRNTTWQGVAGAGKTTALEVVKNAVENRGYKVIGIAAGTQAVKELTSIGVECKTNASVIAGGLKGDRGTFFFGDETGMTGSADGSKIINAIEQNKSRGLFIGDTNQLQAVDSGSPFRIMQKECDTSTLSEIRRQKTPEMLKVANLFSQGKSGEAAQEMGQFMRAVDIGEAADYKEIDQKIADVVAKEYLALPSGNPVVNEQGVPTQTRENTLLLVATNSMRERLNVGIRAGLKAEGTLGATDVQARTLHDTKATREELRQAHYYDGKMQGEDGKGAQIVIIPSPEIRGEGYAIHGVKYADEATQQRYLEMRALAKVNDIEKEAPVILAKGQEYRVQSVDLQKGEVHLTDAENREIIWKPSEAGKVQAFEEKQTAMAVNDKVIFKQNQTIKQPDGKEMKVFNGQKGVVQSVSEDKIYIKTSQGEDVAIDKNGGVRVEHAYSGTVHSMQGATQDYGIAALRAGSQINTANQGYVGQTRFRYEIKVYTDNVAQLQKDWGGYQYQENAIDHAIARDMGKFNQQQEEKKMEVTEKEDGLDPTKNQAPEPEKVPAPEATVTNAASGKSEEREVPESAAPRDLDPEQQPETGAPQAEHLDHLDGERAERTTEAPVPQEPAWLEEVPAVTSEHEYLESEPEPSPIHGQQQERMEDAAMGEGGDSSKEPAQQTHTPGSAHEGTTVREEPEKPTMIRDMPPPISLPEAFKRAEEAQQYLNKMNLEHDFGSPELEAADRNASDAHMDIKQREDEMWLDSLEWKRRDAVENLHENPTQENLDKLREIEKAIAETETHRDALNQQVRGDRQPQKGDPVRGDAEKAQPEAAPREPDLPASNNTMKKWAEQALGRHRQERGEDAARDASGIEARLGTKGAQQFRNGINTPPKQPPKGHDKGMEREM